MKFLFGLLFLLMQFLPVFSQVKTPGIPFIKNYSSQDYHFHPKNFSITQDGRGIMYFGNAYGVIEFDGNRWRTLNLPSGKSCTSLAKAYDGRVIIGSVDEAGQLLPGEKGEKQYHSLVHQFPKSARNLGEVFKTFVLKDQKIFCSFYQLSILEKTGSKTFKPSAPTMVYDFSGRIGNEVYIRESGKGLLKWDHNKLEMVNNGNYFSNEVIYSILPFSSKEILIVSQNGMNLYNGNTLRPFETSLNNFIKKNQITCGIALPHHTYAIGTSKKGILIFDQKGNPLQLLNKKNGLPSDEIYDLFLDEEQNIWAATDNGISYIETSTPFTSISENSHLEGMGYACYIHKNKIYMGTSRGLFVKEWKSYENPLDPSCSFHQIKNLEGQIWYLNEAQGILLCGDKEGLYQIQNEEAKKISKGEFIGGWVFKTFKNRPYLILGTFSGLEIYEKKGNDWVFKNKIKGFDESSRTLEIDEDETIWMCHGNKGLYQIKLNEKLDSAISVKNIGKQQGFKPDYFNDITWIGNQMVFAGENHLYKYNRLNDRLEKFTYLNQFIGEDVLISKILEQKKGDIWIVNNDVIEVLSKQPKGGFIKDKTLFRKLKGRLIGSYEFFWRYDNRNYFIGTQNGFVHFDPALYKNNQKTFHVALRQVETINDKDQVLFGGTFSKSDSTPSLSQGSNSTVPIPYLNNALRFSYSALFYEDHEKNQYQYYLEDLEAHVKIRWSNWSGVTYKEYTNLSEGNYRFHVRAKNIYDQISPEETYSFIILPPWYRTKTAYGFYILFFLFCLGLMAKAVIWKINQEKQRIQKEKEKEMLLMEKHFAEEALKAEREIILLQNEKLEAEVRYKNEELANLATNLSQKTEFLSHLKKDLVSISKEVNTDKKIPSLTELIKTIDKGIEFDDSWDQFQHNFDTIHHNFLFKLREKFPFLKPTDLLLCAYIRMNKSNKEISSLLNISVSAVEKRRFRLREKLKLDNDTKLTEFLIEV